MSKQAQQYDKVFKEIMEALLPPIIEKVLGLQLVTLEEIPDTLQHTKEREPDVFKLVRDDLGNTFVFQLEFESRSAAKDKAHIMLGRLLEYYGMAFLNYQQPVRQYVIYLGTDQPNMQTKLETETLKFEFKLIKLADIPYETFVSEFSSAEEAIIAILANFQTTPKEVAIEKIAAKIKQTKATGLVLQRYFQQLRILANLRGLASLVEQMMNHIFEHIDWTQDRVYQKGFEESAKQSASALKGLTERLKKIEAEKQKAEAEKQKEEAEKEKIEAEKRQAEEAIWLSIVRLLRLGFPTQEVAAITSQTQTYVEKIKNAITPDDPSEMKTQT